MLIAPFADSLLAAGTWLDSAAKYELGADPANLTAGDPLKHCRARGTFAITTGSNDTIAGNDGAGFTATIAQADYGSAQELAVAVTTALNAASTNWRVYQSQAGLWTLLRTAGTASIDPTTGTSALRLVMGFRSEARTAAASHTGDFAAIHAPYQDLATCDLGSTSLPATHAFLAGMDAGPAAAWSVSRGTTTAASTSTTVAGERETTGAVAIAYSDATAYRYVRFTCADPRRSDRPRVGLGCAWHGVPYDTDRGSRADRVEWEVTSYQRANVSRSKLARMRDGGVVASEVRPRLTLRVGFTASPGLSPGHAVGIRRLIRALGRHALAFICLEPARPASSTYLCRVVGTPQLDHRATQGPAGRWSGALEFEVVGAD